MHIKNSCIWAGKGHLYNNVSSTTESVALAVANGNDEVWMNGLKGFTKTFTIVLAASWIKKYTQKNKTVIKCKFVS